MNEIIDPSAAPAAIIAEPETETVPSDGVPGQQDEGDIQPKPRQAETGDASSTKKKKKKKKKNKTTAKSRGPTALSKKRGTGLEGMPAGVRMLAR